MIENSRSEGYRNKERIQNITRPSFTMGGRTDDQGALKILADHFRDTINETKKQLNNNENNTSKPSCRREYHLSMCPETEPTGSAKLKR